MTVLLENGESRDNADPSEKPSKPTRNELSYLTNPQTPCLRITVVSGGCLLRYTLHVVPRMIPSWSLCMWQALHFTSGEVELNSLMGYIFIKLHFYDVVCKTCHNSTSVCRDVQPWSVSLWTWCRNEFRNPFQRIRQPGRMHFTIKSRRKYHNLKKPLFGTLRIWLFCLLVLGNCQYVPRVEESIPELSIRQGGKHE